MEWMIMPLKRYADFSGRSRRMEYWMFILLSALLYIGAVTFLILAIGDGGMRKDPDNPLAIAAILLLAFIFFGLLIPTFAVQVRRFHDQDLSGWLVLLQFIPYVGGLVLFVFMCIDGTAGPNRFGPDPKGRGEAHSQIFA